MTSMLVSGKNERKVEFKFLECPIGYGHNDDLEVCKATMEFDHQCIRRLGGTSILKKSIAGGANQCLIDILPAGS
ncbi:hypothetical protein DSCW_21470 [Desulfosarcina widdelii]|uniref:Uncharacterized protein n=1 Tax=Desulfosarcina widdelii TaxID=947919 RepID=A0A5K7Z246_9BACT|nr:hypothetical protein DSCW_21470 [Desulfosarcina widdelii]